MSVDPTVRLSEMKKRKSELEQQYVQVLADISSKRDQITQHMTTLAEFECASVEEAEQRLDKIEQVIRAKLDQIEELLG